MATEQQRVLNGWKEIARYLGRGVRTIQRWEHELHLPIRRPRSSDRSPVFAVPNELDTWLHQATRQHGNMRDRKRTSGAHALVQHARTSGARAQALHAAAERLQEQTKRAFALAEKLTQPRNSRSR